MAEKSVFSKIGTLKVKNGTYKKEEEESLERRAEEEEDFDDEDDDFN